MSSTLNIGPMIAHVAAEMLEAGHVLDVTSVYDRMVETYGDAIFQSERLLAQAAVRQKIKSHLKNAHSVNGEDEGAQLSLLRDAPAALSVKQPDGGYAYIPLRIAKADDIKAVTAAKEINIANAQASLDKWNEQIAPVLSIMVAEGISFGEAQAIIAEREENADEGQAEAEFAAG